MNRVMRLPVSVLKEMFTLLAGDEFEFDVWGTRYTQEDVFDCLLNNVFEENPHSNEVYLSGEDYNHAARIAYLLVNPDSCPAEIDVGIPSLGYYSIKYP